MIYGMSSSVGGYKMSYHKIIKVPLKVCTKEQLMRYNIARDNYKLWLTKQIYFDEIINIYCETFGAYDTNIDLTLLRNCYANGVFKYYCDGRPILTDYKKIGDYFKKLPSNYRGIKNEGKDL